MGRLTLKSRRSILLLAAACFTLTLAPHRTIRADEPALIPVWTKPTEGARQNLADFVRASQQAIMLVGHPKVGLGTAWVISKKHRLLVTNAHVADIRHSAGGEMLAILNTTAQVYQVERAWYHPGLRRFPKGEGAVLVRSMNPAAGDVYPRGPDVAVLQLAADGPDLPLEWTMGTRDELHDLFAQPAAMIGFPGHDTQAWPALGGRALATFVDGVISRVTDFQLGTNSPDSELQLLQYTMSEWGGTSGSPVFLPNGHVVAVHNMARKVHTPDGEEKTIPHGIRIDCLWELVAHHKLDDRIHLPVDKKSLDIARWLQDDPDEINYRKAVALVNEAATLIYEKQDFAGGAAKCKEASELAPGYARAWYVRAHGSINYWFKYRRQISSEQAREQLALAGKFAQEYVKRSTSDVKGYLLLASVLNNMGAATRDHDYNREALKLVTKVLELPQLSNADKADALSKRAIALDNLDDDEGALRDHNEAVRLAPKEPVYLENRADFWHYQGRTDLEQQDYAAANKLRNGS